MSRPRTARAVLLLLAAGTALAACSSSDDSPPAASSVRVVYRVEDRAQEPVRVTTVIVEDAPPYRGRSRTLAGQPPGTTDLGGTAWDEARVYLLTPGGARVVQAVPPGFSGTARGLDVSLASALRHGLVRSTGTRQVAGRSCTEWVSKDPLDSAAFGPASATDRTTSCVDADGLLLAESWTLHGRLARTRTAISVGRGADLSGTALLSGREPVPAPTSGPGERVQVVSRAVLLKALAVAEPPAPQGFSPDREAAVIQLDPDGRIAVEGGVLTWVNGQRLLVLRLERGLVRPLTPPTRGVVVPLDGARSARLTATSVGLRLSFGQGSFVVTVTADLPEDALLAWAGSLELAG
ncbi:MAG TPA: hypothetical protein VM097_08365 [Mycobacteriales bacterium]|nr:hypothetical protein [Mycobacteriales bacterium]